MNPLDYKIILGLAPRFLIMRPGLTTCLWGADVILSDAVPKGNVYICAQKKALGVMAIKNRRMRLDINPQAVALIKIDRKPLSMRYDAAGV